MYLMFSYYLSDLITISCWGNFYHHLHILCKDKFDPNGSTKTRKREKYILVFFLSFSLLYFMHCVLLSIFTISYGCDECHPLYNIKDCNRVCSSLSDWYIAITIVSCLGEGNNDLVIGVVVGVICSTWDIIYYTTRILCYNDLKVTFASREVINSSELPLQIFVALIDVYLPLITICVNIKINDFQTYIFCVMKGLGIARYFTTCSIFIRINRRITFDIYEYEKLIDPKRGTKDYKDSVERKTAVNESFIKDSNSSVLFKNFRLSDYESENEAQRNLFKENYEKMLKDKKQYGDIP